MTRLRWRLAVFAAVLVVAAVSAGGFSWQQRRAHGHGAAGAPAPPGTGAWPARGPGNLVFRNTALGDGYGRVAVVPLSAPAGPRALTPASCERVYATAANAVCLSADRGVLTTYRARLLDRSWAVRHDLPLAGIPSRTRLSGDGSLVATTSFVFGDSYAQPGRFSTRTVLSRDTGEQVGDLERFTLLVDGAAVVAADRNLWGVTFADGDRFYATAASGGRTWLVQGSVSARRLTALAGDAECPALSPDGRRVAVKQRGDLPPGRWRLAVYELATGRRTVLAETRSVDDQVEWLDDRTVLYGLPRTGGNGAATSDVWQVPADGSGRPTVLVPDAWSPAVLR